MPQHPDGSGMVGFRLSLHAGLRITSGTHAEQQWGLLMGEKMLRVDTFATCQ
jgi:hypothetical protein